MGRGLADYVAASYAARLEASTARASSATTRPRRATEPGGDDARSSSADGAADAGRLCRAPDAAGLEDRRHSRRWLDQRTGAMASSLRGLGPMAAFRRLLATLRQRTQVILDAMKDRIWTGRLGSIWRLDRRGACRGVVYRLRIAVLPLYPARFRQPAPFSSGLKAATPGAIARRDGAQAALRRGTGPLRESR